MAADRGRHPRNQPARDCGRGGSGVAGGAALAEGGGGGRMTGSLAARIAAGLLGTTLTLSACATTPIVGVLPSASAPVPVVYAAIGASETYGIGATDRYRQAWPQVFFNDVLPRSAVLYNFGIPGATTAQALQDEVPAAIAAHPTVVTVWLNVNDLIRGVSAAD
ncbi:MAG: SGNH/GDSL hydrolase family protein, partial [Chloroflexi bacterium]